MNNQPSIRIVPENDAGRRKALDRLSVDARSAVERAGLVLVPDDGFRDFTGPVFPQGTMEFLQFLREHASDGTDVEIAVEDAEYREVAVHFDVVRLATVFVEYAAAPVATGLIAAYLKDWLGSRFTSAQVRAAISVHRKDGMAEQALQISYEGPATTFEKTMSEAIAGLNNPAYAVQQVVPALSTPTQVSKRPRPDGKTTPVSKKKNKRTR